MKVTIRRWKLKKGECLYLDIYHKGVRKRENLNIILDGNKVADAQKLKGAEMLRARRELEYLSDIHSLTVEHKGEEPLADYALRVGSSSLVRSKAHLEAHFGPLQLQAVTKRDVEAFQSRLTASGLKASTVETYLNALVAVLNKAVDEKVIRSNPADGMKRVRAVETPPMSLTDDELAKLEKTPIMGAEGFGGEVKRAFLFACMTGLRWSDLRALTWAKVRVSTTGRQVEATQLKTGKVIYVPVNKTAWLQVDPGDKIMPREAHVFPLLAGSATEPNQYVGKWGELAGVGKIHFHQSRHTFPRFLLDQGVDLATVQKLLGHKKITTTARYAQASDRHLVDAVNRLDSDTKTVIR